MARAGKLCSVAGVFGVARLALGCGLAGCGPTEPAPPEPPTPLAGCWPGSREVLDTCIPAGIQDDGCLAGSRAVGGTCVGPGVAPEACAPGFEPEGRGCRAVLPPTACAAGQLAQLGETICHEVASCAVGTWGDIVVGATTQYVDVSYGGNDSDGSSAKPWVAIQPAVDAASSGATVAIAEGVYVEDVVVAGKPVTFWGRCPRLVSIQGSQAALAALSIGSGAGGAVVRGLAVSGGAAGVLVQAPNTEIDRAWIHDTAGYGVDVRGGASVRVTDTLLEAVRERGIYLEGASARVERTVVRGTIASNTVPGGRGVNARDDPTTHARSNLVLVGSVVDGSAEAGVLVHASDAVVEGSLIRDTRPASNMRFGRGVVVQIDLGTGEPASVAIRASRVEGSFDGGIVNGGSDLTIESTTVVNVAANLDEGTRGYGVDSDYQPVAMRRARLTMSSSLVDAASEAGILVTAGDATLESIVVSGTRSTGNVFGRGLAVQHDPTSGERAIATLVASDIVDNREAGVAVAGSQLTVEGTLVHGTTPPPGRNEYGRGVVAQDHPSDGTRSTVEIAASVLLDNQEVALFVHGSDVNVMGTVIADTRPRTDGLLGVGAVGQWSRTGGRSTLRLESSMIDYNSTAGVMLAGASGELVHSWVARVAPDGDSRFGDGVVVVSLDDAADARVERTVVQQSARAGVSVFGALVELIESEIECNGIDLNVDIWDGAAPQLVDGGGNLCGCATDTRACQAVAASLQVPQPPASIE